MIKKHVSTCRLQVFLRPKPKKPWEVRLEIRAAGRELGAGAASSVAADPLDQDLLVAAAVTGLSCVNKQGALKDAPVLAQGLGVKDGERLKKRKTFRASDPPYRLIFKGFRPIRPSCSFKSLKKQMIKPAKPPHPEQKTKTTLRSKPKNNRVLNA